MSAGFDDWAESPLVFLRKPFEIEDLLASIALVITEREEQGARPSRRDRFGCACPAVM